MTTSTLDKAALVAAIRAGRERLEAAVTSFDDAAMHDRIDEVWTRKDVLAHLAAWERRVVELLERLRAGAAPAERVETDELNARYYAADRDRSLDDIRSGERAAYDRLLAAIDSASDEELFDGGHFAWTDGDPLADWFRGNGDEHYDEHLDQLSRPAR